MGLLSIRNLTVSYGKKSIIRDLSCEFPDCGTIYLLGRNGIGKSTLLKCILGFLTPSAGDIMYQNRRLHDLNRREIARVMSYVPQVFVSNLEYRVFDMVLMGTTAMLHPLALPRIADQERVSEILSSLGILHLQNCYFSRISGGEQRLTLIARALMTNCRVIIMDEPCSNLDFANQWMIQSRIQTLAAQGYLIIQSSHDPNHILRFGDSVLVFQEGFQYSYGDPKQLLTQTCLEDLYQVGIQRIELDGHLYIIGGQG